MTPPRGLQKEMHGIAAGTQDPALPRLQRDPVTVPTRVGLGPPPAPTAQLRGESAGARGSAAELVQQNQDRGHRGGLRLRAAAAPGQFPRPRRTLWSREQRVTSPRTPSSPHHTHTHGNGELSPAVRLAKSREARRAGQARVAAAANADSSPSNNQLPRGGGSAAAGLARSRASPRREANHRRGRGRAARTPPGAQTSPARGTGQSAARAREATAQTDLGGHRAPGLPEPGPRPQASRPLALRRRSRSHPARTPPDPGAGALRDSSGQDTSREAWLRPPRRPLHRRARRSSRRPIVRHVTHSPAQRRALGPRPRPRTALAPPPASQTRPRTVLAPPEARNQ